MTKALEKLKRRVERAVTSLFADSGVLESEVQRRAHEYLYSLVREVVHDQLTKKFGHSLTGPFAPDKRYMSYEFHDYVRKCVDDRLEKDPLPIQVLIDKAVQDTVLNREDRQKFAVEAARRASEARLRERVKAYVDEKVSTLAEKLAEQLLADAVKAILESQKVSEVDHEDSSSE